MDNRVIGVIGAPVAAGGPPVKRVQDNSAAPVWEGCRGTDRSLSRGP